MIKIGKPKIDAYKIVRRTTAAFKESGECFVKYIWADNAWQAKIFEDFTDQVYKGDISLDFRAQYD